MTAPATRIQPPRKQASRWLLLAVLCLSVLLVAVDNMIINIALPTLGSRFSASTNELQWIVDAYTLTFAGLLMLFGHLGDRLGRRRVLQVGLVGFAATSVWAAYADGVQTLIGARAAMGVCAALIYPCTLALLTSVFTDRNERAVAIGVWAGVSGLSVAWDPWPAGCSFSTTGGDRSSWSTCRSSPQP
ncbi:MAG: MFS transporter [Austwickia sp.]|nr:MFS transporter [Austwickia sp.]MBK9102088.1 MFS transporter [Austwickia sp.]